MLTLPGVEVRDLIRHIDDRGSLYELIHKSDPFVEGIGQEIKQVYIVTNPATDIIRAYHAHQSLHDWFHIVAGRAKFSLFGVLHVSKQLASINQLKEMYGSHPDHYGQMFDNPDWMDRNNLVFSETVVTLDAAKPQILTVPPGVFHGWKSLVPGTVMVSCASHEYNRDAPDELRVNPYSRGTSVWEVAAK